MHSRYRIEGTRLLVCICAMLVALPTVAVPPTMQINQPTTVDAEELAIAVNPLDPSLIVAGANINYLFRSTDGGSVWDESWLTSTLGVAGDPCVTFDTDGHLYYSHLSYPFPVGSWLDRIVVQKSTDGGLTWSDGVGVGLNPPKDQDKSWLTADRTDSIHRNNLYLAWTEFDVYGSPGVSDSTRILFSRSTDQGATFTVPVRVSDLGGNCLDEDETVEGATPAVGPNGEVYLAWAGHDQIWFDRSYDGGQTFGTDDIICAQPGGWAFEVSGVYRCNGMPITSCDVSTSAYRGRVYVVFSDQREGLNDTDVFICWSDDQGSTWSAPKRVNDDVGATHQFFPWLSVDPTTGTVSVVFYDRRDTAGDATDVTLAVSRDGGASFHNVKISNSSFTPWSNVFFGDYIGIDSLDGTIYATWMSLDQGDLGVWMAKVTAPSAVDDTWRPESRTSLVMKAPAVTTTRRANIAFTTYQADPVNLSVYDIRGRLVRSIVSEYRAAGSYTESWDGADRSGGSVPSGMYVVRLQSGSDFVTRKIVVVN